MSVQVSALTVLGRMSIPGTAGHTDGRTVGLGGPPVCRSRRSDEHLTSQVARPGEGRPGQPQRRRAGQRGRSGASASGSPRSRLVLLGAIGFVVAYATTDIPQPNELADAQASIVYYADGKTEMDRSSERRATASRCRCRRCPSTCRRRMLAAEDRNFYQNNGISPDGHRAGGRGQRCTRRADPGRLDDHPAVRQELLPHARTDADAQGQGDPHLGQDRPAAVQGPDPRGLPQHHLLRPRRLRHPDRVQGLLRQGRLQAHRRRGRGARLGHPRALALRPGLGDEQKANAEERVTLRPRRHGEARAGSAQAERAKATFPKVIRPTSRARPRAARTATSSTTVQEGAAAASSS